MGFFSKIWVGFTQLIGLIIPFFARAGDFRRWGPGLRWTIRILLLIGLLVLLWLIDKYWLVTFIKANASFMRDFWLPILFLLCFTLSWLGWWLWKLLAPEAESTDFPDIDAAWEEARAALNDGGIDLTEVPLFFILGRSASSDEALLQASQLPFTVRQTPRRADAPLHVYANRDGIYVTCPGASLLGRQALILAGEDEVAAPSAAAQVSRASDDDWNNVSIRLDEMIKTQGTQGGVLKEVHEIMMRAQQEGRMPTAAEKKRMRQLSGIPRQTLLKNPADVEHLTARLRHLCRLIVRDRRPYCPVNGILLLVPLAATDTEEDGNQTALIVQQDLATIRKSFQVHCPLITMLCDLETLPGFREFFERFPDKQRQRRVGQRFPLVPAVEPAAVPKVIENGVQWICETLFPTWVYKFFRVEGPGRESMEDQVRVNGQLYKLMYEIRDRQKPLGRILTRGIITDQAGPLLLGGCYVTATGRDAAREQAFTAGVFRRLIDEQNFVSWTADAIAEESEYIRWTKIGYAAVGVFAALVLVVGFFVLRA